MLPAADLVFVAVPALIWCAWRSWPRVSRPHVLLRCVFVVYLFGVVGVTMFPLPVTPSWIGDARANARDQGRSYALMAGRDYNLLLGEVFADISRHAADASSRGYGYVDSLWFYGKAPLGNLVMLIPLGFMLPWLAARWRRWWRAMTVILATTLVIELTQLFGTLAYGLPYKRFDVDDIWLNFVGGMAGYGLYRLTERLLAAHKAQRPGEADRTSAMP